MATRRTAGRVAAAVALVWATCTGAVLRAQDATAVVPLPGATPVTGHAVPRLAVYVAGSVGRAPARAFGSIVDRTLVSLVLEWQQPLLGGPRAGIAWTPALLPALAMSRVPTDEALIFYDCASTLTPGSRGNAPCNAKWSEVAQARGLALEPLAFRVWRRVGAAELSLRPSVGLTHFARAVPIPEGRRINAILRLDAGATLPVSAHDRLLVQVGWWHVSNAGTGALNPGVDALQLQVGLLHAWGR